MQALHPPTNQLTNQPSLFSTHSPNPIILPLPPYPIPPLNSVQIPLPKGTGHPGLPHRSTQHPSTPSLLTLRPTSFISFPSSSSVRPLSVHCFLPPLLNHFEFPSILLDFKAIDNLCQEPVTSQCSCFSGLFKETRCPNNRQLEISLFVSSW